MTVTLQREGRGRRRAPRRPGDPGLLRALLPRVQCVSEFPLVANLAQQQREGSPGTTPLHTRAEEPGTSARPRGEP